VILVAYVSTEGAPSALLTQSAPFVPSEGWNEVVVPPAEVTAAQELWIGTLVSPGASLAVRYEESAFGTERYDGSVTPGVVPDPFPSSALEGTYRWSVGGRVCVPG
jgi:hypothetical protein